MTKDGILKSVETFASKVRKSQIVFIPGGFSGGDEPDGSGKFITAFFRNDAVRKGVTELLDEICMMYEADLQETKKEFTVDLPDDDLLFIKGDPKKLSRVFENLISNAINYTYDEAKIEVRAWRREADKQTPYETINVDIKDNGIGIPENEIPMIFDRFYRAKNSGKNIKGTGIGLSIVKTIIDRHDATISVDSAIGKGTTFHIELKAAVY